jgi:hypothetical protein
VAAAAGAGDAAAGLAGWAAVGRTPSSRALDFLNAGASELAPMGEETGREAINVEARAGITGAAVTTAAGFSGGAEAAAGLVAEVSRCDAGGTLAVSGLPGAGAVAGVIAPEDFFVVGSGTTGSVRTGLLAAAAVDGTADEFDAGGVEAAGGRGGTGAPVAIEVEDLAGIMGTAGAKEDVAGLAGEPGADGAARPDAGRSEDPDGTRAAGASDEAGGLAPGVEAWTSAGFAGAV